MFLSKLNNKEKEMFLDIAVYTAQSNGIVEDVEKELIMQYCREMGVSFYDISKLHSMQELVDFFSNVSKEKKRIVVLELLGLCYADGCMDAIETAFTEKFAQDIGLSEEIYNMIKKDVEEYSIILGIISGHILND